VNNYSQHYRIRFIFSGHNIAIIFSIGFYGLINIDILMIGSFIKLHVAIGKMVFKAHMISDGND
jgi:hypothetical protein